MGRGPLRMSGPFGVAIRKVVVWLSGAESTVATSPTITAGTAAPSASEPAGSLYLRTNGVASTALDASGTWVDAGTPLVLSDPGDAGAIPVVTSGTCALTSAGAETRTLAIPTFQGQRLTLYCDTYVGDIVLTAASPVNVANNNTLTFGAVSEAIGLEAVSVGGTLAWQVIWNDGVGLTTV